MELLQTIDPTDAYRDEESSSYDNGISDKISEITTKNYNKTTIFLPPIGNRYLSKEVEDSQKVTLDIHGQDTQNNSNKNPYNLKGFSKVIQQISSIGSNRSNLSTGQIRNKDLNKELQTMMKKEFSPHVEPTKRDLRQITYVKKNYIDPTTGFLYSLGCSLVHFSLLVILLTVERPNIEIGKQFDSEFLASQASQNFVVEIHYKKKYEHFCEDNAINQTAIINYLIFVHLLSFFVCLFREIYEANIQLMG